MHATCAQHETMGLERLLDSVAIAAGLGNVSGHRDAGMFRKQISFIITDIYVFVTDVCGWAPMPAIDARIFRPVTASSMLPTDTALNATHPIRYLGHRAWPTISILPKLALPTRAGWRRVRFETHRPFHALWHISHY